MKVELKEVYKSFGRLQVLKGIDLNIPEGGIFAILGPNASGKTTILKSILGLVIPNSGTIKVANQSIKNQWEYRKHINYLPQMANFPENLTVKELITLVKDLRNQESKEQELIANLALSSYLDKNIKHLSGGTQQKLNVVLAFMFDNPIIILDEPTAGLDPVALIKIKDLIRAEKAKGKTILITTHIMSLVEELADEIVFLLEGKIYFKGTLEKLNELNQEPNLERSIAKMLLMNGYAGDEKSIPSKA